MFRSDQQDRQQELFAAHFAEPSAETRRRLIESLMPYAASIAANVSRKTGGHYRLDEAEGDAMVGLCLAVDTLNAERVGKRARSYIGIRVRGYLIDTIRAGSFLPRRWIEAGIVPPRFVSLRAGERKVTDMSGVGEILVHDKAVTDHSRRHPLDVMIATETIDRVLGHFTLSGRQMIRMHIGEDASQEDAGFAARGSCKSAAWKFFQWAKPRLRELGDAIKSAQTN